MKEYNIFSNFINKTEPKVKSITVQLNNYYIYAIFSCIENTQLTLN